MLKKTEVSSAAVNGFVGILKPIAGTCGLVGK